MRAELVVAKRAHGRKEAQRALAVGTHPMESHLVVLEGDGVEDEDGKEDSLTTL